MQTDTCGGRGGVMSTIRIAGTEMKGTIMPPLVPPVGGGTPCSSANNFTAQALMVFVPQQNKAQQRHGGKQLEWQQTGCRHHFMVFRQEPYALNCISTNNSSALGIIGYFVQLIKHILDTNVAAFVNT